MHVYRCIFPVFLAREVSLFEASTREAERWINPRLPLAAARLLCDIQLCSRVDVHLIHPLFGRVPPRELFFSMRNTRHIASFPYREISSLLDHSLPADENKHWEKPPAAAVHFTAEARSGRCLAAAKSTRMARNELPIWKYMFFSHHETALIPQPHQTAALCCRTVCTSRIGTCLRQRVAVYAV